MKTFVIAGINRAAIFLASVKGLAEVSVPLSRLKFLLFVRKGRDEDQNQADIISLKSEEISFFQHLSQITMPLTHPGDGNLFSRSETAVSYVINYRNVFRGEQITQQKRRVRYDTK